jgi:hypothetical protein
LDIGRATGGVQQERVDARGAHALADRLGSTRPLGRGEGGDAGGHPALAYDSRGVHCLKEARPS